MKYFSPRKVVPWLAVLLIAVFAVYRIKFAPVPVTAHVVATGEVRGEMMGTGTLEARVKTVISPRIQERTAAARGRGPRSGQSAQSDSRR